MGQEISAIEQAAPYIVITGVAGDENAQFFVCAEQTIVLESSTVRDAVLDLVASYFVFDILYPECHHSFNIKYLEWEIGRLFQWPQPN